MSVKLEKQDKNIVVLEIEVDNETFIEGLKKSYQKNRNKFNVPGFRRGKAPQAMIERLYGEGVFYEDAINDIIPGKYDEAVEETKIQPVERPEIDVKEIGKDKNFVFTAKVTVKPEVSVTEYKGVEAEKTILKVEDKDVDNELDSVKNRNSRQITIEDRAVEDNDTVDIDFEGFIDGVAFEGGKAENHKLVIGSGSFIPGFEEQLIGKNTGEELEINVKFPDDYHSEEIKGKDAMFKVKINSITAVEYPEMDDEFAKDVSEFDTLSEYKDDLRKKLEEQATSASENITQNNVIKAVLENTAVDVPEVMIDHTIEHYAKDMDMRLQYQYGGLTLEKYLQIMQQTMDDFKKENRERALAEVKTSLLLEKLVELENINASDERVNEEFEKMAKNYGMELEEFKKNIKDSDMEFYREEVNKQLAVELLVENAKLNVVEKPFREDPKPVDGEEESAEESSEESKE